MPRNYVLSERAAAAVGELIAPGSFHGSRPRPARNVPTAAPPPLFDLRVVPGRGGAPDEVQLYLGEDADLAGPNNAVRINGLAVAFAAPAGTPVDGWYPIGSATAVGAVWIVFSAPALADATNWSGYGVASVAPVAAQIATTYMPVAPVTPSYPADRVYHRLLLWYRPGSAWFSTGSGPWTRCVAGGADITIDLADGDASESHGSLEHPSGGPVALRSFAASTPDAWPSSPTGYDLVARQRGSAGNRLRYLPLQRVGWIDAAGNLVVGSDTYAPTQITIEGQTITVLAKQ